MTEETRHIESLNDIRKLMERSSRFISLSGLSGIAAGFCALVASWVANGMIADYRNRKAVGSLQDYELQGQGYQSLEQKLVVLGAITFAASCILAFLFTYLRSKKTGVPIWGHVARKVMVHVIVPMIVGGLMILRLIDISAYGLIAPACLIFYGLALINASKFTFSEIRYMGYGELILGSISLWMPGSGLIFWAIGFGVLHIVYGFMMWWKNERNGGQG